MARKRESAPGPRIRKAAETVVSDKQAKPSKTSRLTRLGPVFKPVAPFFGAIGRVLKLIVPRYFINSWKEVRLVTWPSRRETWRLTLAVFVFALIFGALVAGVDRSLDFIFKKLVLR